VFGERASYLVRELQEKHEGESASEIRVRPFRARGVASYLIGFASFFAERNTAGAARNLICDQDLDPITNW
jgi:hypothetical protein